MNIDYNKHTYSYAYTYMYVHMYIYSFIIFSNIESWENAEYFYFQLESLKLKIVKRRYSVYRAISLQSLNKLWQLWVCY